MNSPLRIFLSHSSTYVDLAKSLKRALRDLESGPNHLDVRISAEMAGTTDWREWIEDNARSANVFLFLYPHPRMEMNWCHYELGRFYDAEKRPCVVCLKNVDIPKPPPAFEPYQAYTGDREGIAKFLRELFVDGVFSNGQALNPEVGKVGTESYERAKAVAEALADRFTQARVRERLYDRRIELAITYEGNRLDEQRTDVTGNPEGLEVLGLEADSRISWASLKASPAGAQPWLQDLEQALPAIATGVLPPSLSPLRKGREIFVPVISRAEDVDSRLRRVAVIFVGIPGQHLMSLAGWATPPAMPAAFAELVRLVRTLLRTRWELLEPRLAALRYGALSDNQAAGLVNEILSGYADLTRDAQQRSPMGAEAFLNLFDATLWPEVDATEKAFGESYRALKESASGGGRRWPRRSSA